MVNDQADLFQDPQLRHRRHFNLLDHPEIGPHSIAGQPSILSVTPAETRRAPLLGEHNEVVLKGFLGMGDDEYINLLINEVLK